MRIKIGDDFLDMDSSVIAQTYAVNEIGNLKTRQGGFSNDFTIPLTARNQGLLGVPGDINSASRNPYTKVQASLFDNSAPVAFGFLKYQIFNDTTLQCSFFADNSDWYNLIKDRKLIDIELSDLDHNWTHTVIGAAINADKDSGYTYPLIEYGEFSANSTLSIDSDQMFPCIFISDVLIGILFDIGWKADGEVIDHPLFKRMIIPFSAKAFVHSQQWIADNVYSDTNIVGFLFDDNGTEITWITAASTDIDVSTAGLEKGEYTVLVTCNVTIAAGSFAIRVKKNAVNIGVLGFISAPQTAVNFTIEITGVDLDPTVPDLISVELITFQAPETATLNSATISIDGEDQISLGSEIQMSATLPDIKQSDFIRYIAFIFGAVIQANTFSKTVTFSFFKSLKDNLDNALDWSNKIDIGSTREVDFTQLLNNYAIVSIMTYKEDSDDAELSAYEAETGKRFGEGQFDIANDHIPGIKTIYTSPFTSMININTFDNTMYIPQIRYRDAAGANEIEPKPKIGILSKNISVPLLSIDEYTVLRINDPDSASFTDAASIPFCWFAKTKLIDEVDELLDSLPFDQINFPNVIGDPLKDRFLKDYEDILNSMKYLKAFFHLTEVDINELDFTIPVFIEHYKAYFYISQILNFEGSKNVTEAELTKIA